MNWLSRRKLLMTTGATIGSVMGGVAGSFAHAQTKGERRSAADETGDLSILTWGGYEAAGTSAQTYGLIAGKDYTDKYGTDGLSYTYIASSIEALHKARISGPFDIIHPCVDLLSDYKEMGSIQPWNPDLLPSFNQLNPSMVERCMIDGELYMIPWEWGFASLLYRKDKVDEADATGWELAWNPKYKGLISLQDSATNNMETAALKLGFDDMDNMSREEINIAKAELIKQKEVNSFYWTSQYGQMHPAFKAGDIAVAFGWNSDYVTLLREGLDMGFMWPSQGIAAYLCGFALGAQTENYHRAHEYVESFIKKEAAAQMTNLYLYGNSNMEVAADDIEDQTLVDELRITDPEVLDSPDVHLQSPIGDREAYELAWQEVMAS